MKRATAKKAGERQVKQKSERRKHERSSRSARGPKSAKPQPKAQADSCYNCSKDLSGSQRALFVEEEIGRIFCSESCIAGYFSPEIERLEKEYFRRLSNNDLTGEERESLEHLRWITLQEPDEVWCEKSLNGDLRYTLISEFQPGDKRIWCICITLFLRGEPSFLYLAFPTKNAAMVQLYRKGESVTWERPKKADGEKAQPLKLEDPNTRLIDRLADSWTEEETLRAQLTQERNSADIPSDEYGMYQTCLEGTLETPDEVWSVEMTEEGEAAEETKLYHFIKRFEDQGIWYMIVAKETESEEEIEILDAFPTRDPLLVERYRRGHQELGDADPDKSPARVIH